MSRDSYVDFAAVKKKVSIVQILEHYKLTNQLRRIGQDGLMGSCPIHQGKNKTAFRVSISKNCWNCFSDCKCGGNILDFVSKKEGVSIRRAATLIRDWFDLRFDEPANAVEEKAEVPVKKAPVELEPGEDVTENVPLKFSLQSLESDHPYFQEREITPETRNTFGLGFCTKGILAGRIAIPIHNRNGELVAYAGRWPGEPSGEEEKYKLPKGFKKTLEVFNLHRAGLASQDKPMVVVEGFFGCMRLWQSGVRSVVAVMGSSLSPAQAEQILQAIAPDQRIILLFDEDDAGREGRKLALPQLAARAFVRVAQLQREGMQADDLSPGEIGSLGLKEASIPYKTVRPGFCLGVIQLTPGVMTEIPGIEIAIAVLRHMRCDWGDVDQEQKALNEKAFKEGSRLLSAHKSRAGVKFYVVTEADRKSTMIILRSEILKSLPFIV